MIRGKSEAKNSNVRRQAVKRVRDRMRKLKLIRPLEPTAYVKFSPSALTLYQSILKQRASSKASGDS